MLDNYRQLYLALYLIVLSTTSWGHDWFLLYVCETGVVCTSVYKNTVPFSLSIMRRTAVPSVLLRSRLPGTSLPSLELTGPCYKALYLVIWFRSQQPDDTQGKTNREHTSMSECVKVKEQKAYSLKLN